MTAPILEQIPEWQAGAPGWNAMVKKMLQRVNAMPEIVLDALADRIINGSGFASTYNGSTKTFTFSATGGGGGTTDLEAILDFLATNLTVNGAPGTYDDPNNVLNFAVAPYSDEAVDDRVAALLATGWGIRKTYDDPNNLLKLENRGFGSTPADHGLKAWTVHPDQASASTAPSTGVIYLVRFRLSEAGSIANLPTRLSGSSTTPTNCYVGLYDLAGNRLAVSADLSAAWSTAGEKTNPLAAAYAGAADTDYVAAILTGGGTPMAMARSTQSNMSNFGIALPAFRLATFGSGLTALPATINFANAVNNTGLNQFWMGAS